jgi:hypothetical protein
MRQAALSAAARALRTRVAVLVATTLAGCGGVPSDSHRRRVVDDPVRAAGATTRLSQRLLRQWCPQAVRHGGRDLTQPQARKCLRRARDAWLRDLRRGGYDPGQVGRGPGGAQR